MSVFESFKNHGNLYIVKDKIKIPADMPEMHYHDCHELYFQVSGARRYFIGHTIYNTAPGNVLIIPKYELHRTTARNTNSYERYVVYFYEESLGRLADIIDKKTLKELICNGCIQLPLEYAEQIRTALKSMYDEMKLQKPYYETVLQNLFCNIIILLLRHGQIKAPLHEAETDKIQEIAQYISDNYAADITLGSAAQMIFIEKTYLSKKFKQLTGFGFNEYLTQTRLKAALALLRTSDLAISEISERCGFSNSNYFGDTFKRFIGVSPSRYRQAHR